MTEEWQRKAQNPQFFVSEVYSYIKLSAETQVTDRFVLKLTSTEVE